MWEPAGAYIAATTDHPEEAKQFLAFIASVPGTEAMTAGAPPAGPYLIKGSTLPDDALPAIKDLQAYIDAGNASPALEFLSPVKGPNLEFITVEVGSGSAERRRRGRALRRRRGEAGPAARPSGLVS